MGVLYRGVFFVAQGLQISESGLLVALDIAFTIGDLALATLILPDGDSVVARCAVVHFGSERRTGLPEYGLSFVNIEITQRRHIRKFVSSQTRREADFARLRIVY